MSDPVYPKDRRTASHRGEGIWCLSVLRALWQSGAANDIGQASCWLVSIVASHEDKFFYSKPVMFWNSQLMQAAGMSSKQSFLNARAKAVKSGWLVHIEGRKGVAGQYWTSIPAHALSVLGISKSDEHVGPDSDRQNEVSGPDSDRQNEVSGPDSDRQSTGDAICRSGFRSESEPATGPHSYPLPTDPKKQGAALPDAPKSKFRKPTAQEVQSYAQERNAHSFDAEYFCDHYESNGWRIGKNPMKDWQATVRKWIRNGANGSAQAGLFQQVVAECVRIRLEDHGYPQQLKRKFGDATAKRILNMKVANIKAAADSANRGFSSDLKALEKQFNAGAKL